VDAEAEGFAQFVEARQRALQRTAWLLTGDWALAEDLVQTALYLLALCASSVGV
jgi:DNA-directed RNA polymerase specialized sigma24 family protein